MIRLTRAIVAARPWHALSLFLLGLLAIGAAVAAPAYARMAQASVAGSDIAATPTRQLSVIVTKTVKLQPMHPDDPNEQIDPNPDELPTAMSKSLDINGFRSVYDVSMQTAGGRTAADYVNPDDNDGSVLHNTVLSYRSDACAHLTFVTGRCVAAPLEVMISDRTATLLHGGVGATMQIQFVVAVQVDRLLIHYFPIGDPRTLSVVGIYHAPDLSSDPYWAGSPFALVGPNELTGLIGPDTLAAVQPYTVDQSYLVYPGPGALAPDKLAAVHADADQADAQLRTLGYNPTSQLRAVLDQIGVDQRRVAVGPAVAGAPLVVLCWFVIFLAVAQTAQARRPELALLKLRGTSTVDRWWLSAAESVVPLVAGAVVGFFAGHLAVLGFGRLTLDHPGPLEFTGTSLLYAVTALVGALLAGLLALRRDLAAPVAQLMRRVVRHTPAWQNAVVVAVVATLAAVAVVEAHENASADPTGLVLLGPALVVLAIGLLLAGLLDPLAERIGVVALRRGRLGLGLAALQIGRPRASRRVVALLTIAVGLFVFAVTANEVSGQVRTQQARFTLGAPRVLTVEAPDAVHLLNAVRSIDPHGAFAMAVEELPSDGTTGTPVLAVDASRLSTVAFWPGSGSAAAVATMITPSVAPSIVVTGRDMLVDATFVPAPQADAQSGAGPIDLPDTLGGFFAPVQGGKSIISTEVTLQPGVHTYRLEMPCLDGCRLTGLAARLSINDRGASTLTLTRLRSGDGKTTLATAAQLSPWLDRSRGTLSVSPAPDGLKLQGEAFSDSGGLVTPNDQTDQLPVIAAGNGQLQALPTADGNLFADTLATTDTLPRLGAAGGIGDLSLALHDGALILNGTAEVWLNDHAPPDIVDRLAKAGLPVISDQTLAQTVADSGQRPSALGWRFFVVLGALALVLGVAGLLLSATVERRTRAYALRAMRVQGLRWPAVTASGLIGYLAIVLCGLIFGAGAALVAWWLDGAYLPIVDGRPLGQGLPGWPGAVTLRWSAVAAAGLVLVAIAATAALARSVRQQREFGGGPAE
jgi:hypothetical protein